MHIQHKHILCIFSRVVIYTLYFVHWVTKSQQNKFDEFDV